MLDILIIDTCIIIFFYNKKIILWVNYKLEILKLENLFLPLSAIFLWEVYWKIRWGLDEAEDE